MYNFESRNGNALNGPELGSICLHCCASEWKEKETVIGILELAAQPVLEQGIEEGACKLDRLG